MQLRIITRGLTAANAIHPLQVAVAFGLWRENEIGPYFFENVDGLTITVNGDTYSIIKSDFFIPTLDAINVNDVWFQQDSATYHTYHVTIDLLHQMFDGRLIRRTCDANFPPKNCKSKLLCHNILCIIRRKATI